MNAKNSFNQNEMQSATRFYSWTTTFLIHISDLGRASRYLTAIMLADDTYLFSNDM